MIGQRVFSCNPRLETAIASHLTDSGWSNRWPDLAKSVLHLSEVFNQTEVATPWEKESDRAAYLAYFMPLNSARLTAVFTECQKLKLKLTDEVVDFGAGAGTAQWSWPFSPPQTWLHCEISEEAQKLYRHLTENSGIPPAEFVHSLPPSKGRTVIASYVLTELPFPPKPLLDAENLIIVEPSLQATSRKLMTYRQTLTSAGFHIWAPCTHQQDCPLLFHSPRDWCHDRIFFKGPSWWEDLSRYLPMRNETLTYSYLIASKQVPVWQKNDHSARVIGDTLFEKGKVRQAVCRGPEREFLAWLTRDGEPEQIPHGSLIELPQNIEKKGNELRMKTLSQPS